MSNPSYIHRFVFLAPPRTGSRRIYQALVRDCELLGGEDRGDHRQMSHRMEIPEGCDGFDRVATIRNPFSRMVSCWNWMRKMENPAAHSPLERFLIHHKGEDPRDFWAFVREVEQNPHWLPSQSAQFRKIWPTHTVRYERPLEDYQALPWTPSQTRLHTTPQDPRTASWRAQYDEPTRKLVVKLWGDDFGSLGYSVDL